MDKQISRTRDIMFLYFSNSSSFSNPGSYSYPQCTSGHWVTSLEGINQIRCSFLLSHRRLHATWLPDLFTPVPFRRSHAKRRVQPGLTSNSIRVKMQIINTNEKINHVLLRKYQLKTGSSLTVKCRGVGGKWTREGQRVNQRSHVPPTRRVVSYEKKVFGFWTKVFPLFLNRWTQNVALISGQMYSSDAHLLSVSGDRHDPDAL